MRSKRKSRNPHLAGVMMDLAHIVLCVGIVAFAVLVFLNPEQYRRLFPMVFALAAMMQFLHGIPKISAYRRTHGSNAMLLAAGAGICVLGVILAALAFVSAVTIWR